MKTFRTEIIIPRIPFQIENQETMLSLGSCFSEEIGKRFLNAKFNIYINPFGQQYNPFSIADGLMRLADTHEYRDEELIYFNHQYHSFDHHGNYSSADKVKTLQNINETLSTASSQLKDASIIWITPGTAHVFEHLSSKRIVNNCHKMPSAEFNLRLLSADEIYDKLISAIEKVRNINPKCKFIFTVSPVRYFALGHFENSISKGRLFDAVYRLTKQAKDVFYFPSYELVIDELRDYRFYKTDMLHPSEEAIDFVWNKLQGWMSAKCIKVLTEAESIHQMLIHKPMTDNYSELLKFYEHLIKRMHLAENSFGLKYVREIKAINDIVSIMLVKH